MERNEKNRLQGLATEVRKKIIRSIHQAQTGHAGPSLSMVEILVILYFKYMRYNPKVPEEPTRDFFVLSKGHGAPGLYATLAQAGILPNEELFELRQLNSRLQGHPNANLLPGIDVSTGSLGQGLSVAVGMALALKIDKRKNNVFCVLGDGELQEGQNWEAAMAAAAYNVSNLVCFVDRNHLQGDGNTEEVMPLGDLKSKWKAFGWQVFQVNGHDFEQLNTAIGEGIRERRCPTIIIANTVKGKGVAYMENVVHWHHHPINDEEYKTAIRELEGEGYDI